LQFDFIATLANRLPIENDDAADAVLAGFGVALPGQFDRTAHPPRIVIIPRHDVPPDLDEGLKSGGSSPPTVT
jgi:hypothetical protein